MTTFKNSKYYTDREITVERKDFYGTGDTLIGVHDAGVHLGETVGSHMYLEDSTAHALADWIITNVPKPEPTPLTLSEWAEMPIGAEFGFGKWGDDSSFPYVKVDEWTYRNHQSKHSADIREGTENDLSRGLTWRLTPLPTKFAAVVKSKGALYTLADDEKEPKWIEAGTNGGTWANSDFLRDQGFEVIFDGVEDDTEAAAVAGVDN